MNDSNIAIFTLVCLIVMTLLCVMPFHCFYLRARLKLAKTLGQVIISPFGIVRFRHFFLADVLTSMISPIQDLAIIGCFFVDGNQDWKRSEHVDFGHECGAGHSIFISLGFIPYWWRFAQCLRKVYDDKKKNAV
jgi:hypothetical protein